MAPERAGPKGSRRAFDSISRRVRNSGVVERACPRGEQRSDRTPPDDSDNPSVNFHGERRQNATHQSTTDPEARLAKKGAGKEAKLCYTESVLMENRNRITLKHRQTLLALQSAFSENGSRSQDYRPPEAARRAESEQKSCRCQARQRRGGVYRYKAAIERCVPCPVFQASRLLQMNFARRTRELDGDHPSARPGR